MKRLKDYLFKKKSSTDAMDLDRDRSTRQSTRSMRIHHKSKLNNTIGGAPSDVYIGGDFHNASGIYTGDTSDYCKASAPYHVPSAPRTRKPCRSEPPRHHFGADDSIHSNDSPPIDRQSEIAYYRYKPDRTTIKAASTSEYGSGDPSPTTSHQNPHHHLQQQVQPLTSQQHRHHHSHGRSRDSSTRNNDYNAQLSIGYHGKRPPPKSASDSEAFKVPTGFIRPSKETKSSRQHRDAYHDSIMEQSICSADRISSTQWSATRLGDHSSSSLHNKSPISPECEKLCSTQLMAELGMIKQKLKYEEGRRYDDSCTIKELKSKIRDLEAERRQCRDKLITARNTMKEEQRRCRMLQINLEKLQYENRRLEHLIQQQQQQASAYSCSSNSSNRYLFCGDHDNDLLHSSRNKTAGILFEDRHQQQSQHTPIFVESTTTTVPNNSPLMLHGAGDTMASQYHSRPTSFVELSTTSYPITANGMPQFQHHLHSASHHHHRVVGAPPPTTSAQTLSLNGGATGGFAPFRALSTAVTTTTPPSLIPHRNNILLTTPSIRNNNLLQQQRDGIDADEDELRVYRNQQCDNNNLDLLEKSRGSRHSATSSISTLQPNTSLLKDDDGASQQIISPITEQHPTFRPDALFAMVGRRTTSTATGIRIETSPTSIDDGYSTLNNQKSTSIDHQKVSISSSGVSSNFKTSDDSATSKQWHNLSQSNPDLLRCNEDEEDELANGTLHRSLSDTDLIHVVDLIATDKVKSREGLCDVNLADLSPLTSTECINQANDLDDDNNHIQHHISSSQSSSSSSSSDESCPDQRFITRQLMRSRKKGRMDVGKVAVRYSPPRPTILGRTIYKKFGDRERKAIASFDFLKDVPTDLSGISSSPTSPDQGAIAPKYRKTNNRSTSLAKPPIVDVVYENIGDLCNKKRISLQSSSSVGSSDDHSQSMLSCDGSLPLSELLLVDDDLSSSSSISIQ